MKAFVDKVVDFIAPYWKAVMALAVPLLWAALIDLVDALQGTFADEPIVAILLTTLAVWAKSNRPRSVSN